MIRVMLWPALPAKKENLAAIRRLTVTEVEAVRVRLQVHQGNKCLLCGCSLKGKVRGGPALDHCHDTGFIRGVLCMTCNGGEGKVKSAAVRYGGGNESYLSWLKKLVDYLTLHSTPQYRFLHPTHRTEDEKRELKNKRARKRAKEKKLSK